ncbi:amino acid/amide ABC transporter membrane protein 1, HAAT family [Gemmobacter megaterium]|uniref:Amino acid/amide ABC transporter membrane protein 1, HAAT family n=1 Tax=Gemmobacter megaterium TaxID=1086013 RepID=A0A1N7N201_9RHOB|nr:branched-chain amino acid ABC transporter permease [Gemmobacter megaterium]GGE12532.1 branched-chain amino acid ABC transporter permease [Gemmobacter megaterium]SIS92298.1 amino acid/amide ABC transporter membrane protein 1, HAAT family [Gemmobacter megaterium]
MTEYLIQQLLNALAFGAEYALIALGLAVVFSIMGLVNFAHGEVIAASAYAALLFAGLGLGAPLLVIGLAIAAAIAVSVTLERVAFRPVRNAPVTTGLLTAFGVSIVLQNLFQLLISPRPQAFPALNGLNATWHIGPWAVSSLQVMELVVALLAMLALGGFLGRSSLGIAMRAASRDFATVRLMGIQANRVVAAAFVISGALAGIACVFILARRGGVTPDMGFSLVLKAFVACVIGGFGSLFGAAAGGMLLGFIEVGLLVLLPQEMGGLKEALTYVIVTLILVYRPEGLFGSRRDLGDKEF